jgi:hypothetical protein
MVSVWPVRFKKNFSAVYESALPPEISGWAGTVPARNRQGEAMK